MLTAKGEDVDRIVGLEMGADDYLPKPFNPRELVARIHAVLRRRAAPLPPGAPSPDAESVSFGGITFNLATRTLSKNGETVALTTGEFALLKVLVTHPRVAALARQADGARARPRVRGVRPRDRRAGLAAAQAVEADPANPTFIQTVWGFGYVFVPDGKADGVTPGK